MELSLLLMMFSKSTEPTYKCRDERELYNQRITHPLQLRKAVEESLHHCTITRNVSPWTTNAAHSPMLIQVHDSELPSPLSSDFASIAAEKRIL